MRNNDIIFATVLDIIPKKEYEKNVEFDSFRELINYYIEQNNLSNTFNSLKKKLETNISRKIKKDEKILKSLAREKEEYLHFRNKKGSVEEELKER